MGYAIELFRDIQTKQNKANSSWKYFKKFKNFLSQVKELLLKVQGNLEVYITEETAAEEKAQADFEADIKRSEDDIVTFTASLEETNEQLSATEEQILNTQSYIEERQADKASYETDVNILHFF